MSKKQNEELMISIIESYGLYETKQLVERLWQQDIDSHASKLFDWHFITTETDMKATYNKEDSVLSTGAPEPKMRKVVVL